MLKIRYVIVALALLLATAATTTPASAGIGGPVCGEDPAGCDISVTTPGAPGSPGTSGKTQCKTPLGGEVVPCYVAGKGWYGGDGCWYEVATGNELAAAIALGGTPTPPAQWYVGSCGDPVANVWFVTKFRVFGAGPGPELLAQEAVKALRLPNPLIKVNPPAGSLQVLYVPTWLWVDASTWGSRSATASAGGLSVTATAKPTKVVWSASGGPSTTCNGPGTPWTAGTDPAKASPTCGVTFTAVPGGGTSTLRATVTWAISWAGGGATGTVPDLTTTAAVDLQVQRAGGLNSNGS
jgi:hypothetical protein